MPIATNEAYMVIRHIHNESRGNGSRRFLIYKMLDTDRFNILHLTGTLNAFKTYKHKLGIFCNSGSCKAEVKRRIRMAKMQWVECTKYRRIAPLQERSR